MSTVSGSQYGVGLITLLVAASIGIGYYQMFYLPEPVSYTHLTLPTNREV